LFFFTASFQAQAVFVDPIDGLVFVVVAPSDASCSCCCVDPIDTSIGMQLIPSLSAFGTEPIAPSYAHSCRPSDSLFISSIKSTFFLLLLQPTLLRQPRLLITQCGSLAGDNF